MIKVTGVWSSSSSVIFIADCAPASAQGWVVRAKLKDFFLPVAIATLWATIYGRRRICIAWTEEAFCHSFRGRKKDVVNIPLLFVIRLLTLISMDYCFSAHCHRWQFEVWTNYF